MIVLSWLQKPPASLKTFVANRISSIQESLPYSHWRHVPTTENPADLLSRGMKAEQLIQNSLWWKGTPWLAKTPDEWPVRLPNQPANLPGLLQCYSNTYSSFHHRTRIVAWAHRFISNCQISRHKRIYDTTLESNEVA